MKMKYILLLFTFLSYQESKGSDRESFVNAISNELKALVNQGLDQEGPDQEAANTLPFNFDQVDFDQEAANALPFNFDQEGPDQEAAPYLAQEDSGQASLLYANPDQADLALNPSFYAYSANQSLAQTGPGQALYTDSAQVNPFSLYRLNSNSRSWSRSSECFTI